MRRNTAIDWFSTAESQIQTSILIIGNSFHKGKIFKRAYLLYIPCGRIACSHKSSLAIAEPQNHHYILQWNRDQVGGKDWKKIREQMPIQSNVISNYVEGNSCSIFGAWFFSLWSSFSMNFYIKKQSPTAFICFSWWLGLCLYIWSIGRAYKKVSRVRCIMQESQFLSIHKESYLHLRHKETILKVRIHSRPILSYAHRWGDARQLWWG